MKNLIGKNEKAYRDQLNGIYNINDKNEIFYLTDDQVYSAFDLYWNEHCKTKENEEQPTFTLVVAQPGSGKTSLVNKIKNLNNNIMISDVDEFRKYHPNFNLFKDSENFASYTQNFALTFSFLLMARCIDTKHSILIEATLRNTNKMINNIQLAKENNFKINTHFLIAKKEDSMLGVYYRALLMLENNLIPRITPIEVHNGSCEGIKNFLNNQNNIDLIDNIYIYNRSLIQLNKINLKDKNEILNIIENELNRKQSKNELNELKKQKIAINKNKNQLLKYISTKLNEINVEIFKKTIALK